MKRGALIVFEGCDRSGKSTQCLKLFERLKSEGQSVELMKFPDRTTAIGKMIDSYLKQSVELDDHTVHLLFSANRWEVYRKMKDLLLSGTSLIVDRYAYSGIAFTAAKGLSIEWCRQPDIGLIKPDKVLYMTVSGDAAFQRAQFGEERYEKVEFQNKVKEIFQKLKDSDYWQDVNGDATIPEVHEEVYKLVDKAMVDAEAKPLSKLWSTDPLEN